MNVVDIQLAGVVADKDDELALLLTQGHHFFHVQRGTALSAPGVGNQRGLVNDADAVGGQVPDVGYDLDPLG